jgi:hypothetical protein
MSVRRAHQLLIGITLMVGANLAEADVVSPPPTDCPPGTTAAVNHAGPHCLPTSCDDARQCPTGQICATQQLCWVERFFTNWTGEHRVEVVRGPCQSGQCPEGTCRAERVCMAQIVAAGGRPEAPRTANLGRSVQTGGSGESAQSPDTRQGPTPVDGPRPPPAGCRGVAVAGAVVGGMMVALLAVIVFLLRRRRTNSTSIPKQAKSGRNHRS